MTIQEAISRLKADKEYLVGHKVCDGEEIDVAIESLEKQTEYQNRIKALIDTIEEICRNSRAIHLDEEHCGLCKYDGAYIGASVYWYNACPGFDTDDCFELSEKFKKKYIDWEE